MKIAIITTRSAAARAQAQNDARSSQGSLLDEVVRRLNEKEIEVDLLYPEESPADLLALRPQHDLYIVKSSAEVALSFAAALDAAGAKMLNPYAAVAQMKDKIITTKILQAAGVPIPAAYFAADAGQLAPFLSDGALILKPFWAGSKGRGVEIVRTVEELAAVVSDESPVFAQRYYAPDGRDHKLYCIGDEMFGVRRVWPARTYEEKLGEPFAVTEEMRRITLQCGAAFGIDLFGVDLIFSDGKPLIVDINSFPGFKGMPDAARLLAEYLYAKITSW